jgi:hypothetical protein
MSFGEKSRKSLSGKGKKAKDKGRKRTDEGGNERKRVK